MISQSPPRRELCKSDNPVRHTRTIDNAIVLSRHPYTAWIRHPFVQGHCPVQFDIRLVSRSFDSCHSCLRRYCTFSYAIHQTVRSRTEKADAMTFVSQFDPQTSSWFDRSSCEVQQCRTPSTNCTKSSPDELHQHSSKKVCPSTMSNSIDSRITVTMVTPTDYNVELHRLSSP